MKLQDEKDIAIDTNTGLQEWDSKFYFTSASYFFSWFSFMPFILFFAETLFYFSHSLFVVIVPQFVAIAY